MSSEHAGLATAKRLQRKNLIFAAAQVLKAKLIVVLNLRIDLAISLFPGLIAESALAWQVCAGPIAGSRAAYWSSGFSIAFVSGATL